MKLSLMENSYQALSIAALAVASWLELGTRSAGIAVVVVFILTALVAGVVRGATALARVPKWILLFMATWLLVAYAIFTFGNPLAGVIYWSSCALAGTVVLPSVTILLVVRLIRGDAPRVVLPQIIVCILIGMLCFTRT